MIVRRAVVVIARVLLRAAALGVVSAGRRAARPIMAVNQAVIVEIGGRGGIGHGGISDGVCCTYLRTDTAVFHPGSAASGLNSVKRLTCRIVKLQSA